MQYITFPSKRGLIFSQASRTKFGVSKSQIYYSQNVTILFCFRPSFHVSCPACGVKFCSKACQDEAWDSFHKTLCIEGAQDHPLITLNEIWKTCHYPPESTRYQAYYLLSQSSNFNSCSDIRGAQLYFSNKLRI